MAEPEIISPRGVPQMRIDWIADVARRLAEVGLPRLRALDEEQHGHLTDLVDGESWAFQLMKFSAEHETTVEFDAELWAPADDRAKPTLRAGFALAPRWEEGHGNTTLVRVEIGPRGAVTFDPQNWMLSIPLDEVGSPSPAGVAAGAWTFDGDATQGGPPAAERPGADLELLERLPGTRLDLSGLKPILSGDLVPELVAGAFAVGKPKGFLGRLRGGGASELPSVTLRIMAAGPLTAAWTGNDDADEAVATGLLLGDTPPVLTDGQISFRGPDGTLTLAGPKLAVHLAASA